MDKKWLDNKSTSKNKPEQSVDLKGYHDRRKRDGEVKLPGGDAEQLNIQGYRSEVKSRHPEHSKVVKPSFNREKSYKADHSCAERDLPKRFIDRSNRDTICTRTNLKFNPANKVDRDETVKQESGLRSIINIVNQVQTVLANKTNELNVNNVNYIEKPKRKKSLRVRKSEIETAVANVKVSEVQIAESLVNRFKENCLGQTKETTEKTENEVIHLPTAEPTPPTPSRTLSPQRIVQSYSAIQKKYDLATKCFDRDEVDVKKPAMENHKTKNRYTVITEPIPYNSRVKSRSYRSFRERVPRGANILLENKSNAGPAAMNNDLGTLKADTKDKQKKKLVIKAVCLDTGDPKFYKVSFEEHKNQPTQLQIKIPNGSQSKRSIPPKEIEYDKKPITPYGKNTKVTHKTNVKRRKEVKIDNTFRRKDGKTSPPTEVAKWAPLSVDAHSQPYYEAWVDTTLTAISNTSEGDYKRQVIESFMKLIEKEERPPSPELAYDRSSDQSYTGKIKIRTKGVGVK